MGAAGNTSGMSRRPADSRASFCAEATSSAMRRTDVTPQLSIVLRSSSDSACTCASISPGTIHFPSAVTTCVAGGRALRASGVAGPTDTIRPSEMTKRTFGRGAAPVPSMSVAPRNARVANRSVLTADRSLFFEFLFRNLDRIDSREARRARGLERPPERFEHPFRREIAQGIGSDELPDLLDRIVGGDQLAAGRRIDAVVARGHRRRRGHAHVDLADAGFAQHPHDLSGRRPAHDRVVHEDDPLALDHLADRIQLHLDAEVADGLFRLDEGPADVVVSDEPESERDPRLACVTE